MARERLPTVASIVEKTSHWPYSKRREYIAQALQQEKGRHRREMLLTALRGITTRVLQKEIEAERKEERRRHH